MKREISDFIKDILDAIDDIEEFVKGLDFENKIIAGGIKAKRMMGVSLSMTWRHQAIKPYPFIDL